MGRSDTRKQFVMGISHIKGVQYQENQVRWEENQIYNGMENQYYVMRKRMKCVMGKRITLCGEKGCQWCEVLKSVRCEVVS